MRLQKGGIWWSNLTATYMDTQCGSFELNEHQLRQPLLAYKLQRSYRAGVYPVTGNTGRVTQPRAQQCVTTVSPIVSPHAIVSHCTVLTIVTSRTPRVTADCQHESNTSMPRRPSRQQQRPMCWPHGNRPIHLIPVYSDICQNTFAHNKRNWPAQSKSEISNKRRCRLTSRSR